MNRIQEIIAQDWKKVEAHFNMSVRIWATTVLEGDYDYNTLEVLANLISTRLGEANAQAQAEDYARKAARLEADLEKAQAEERRAKEDLHEARSQWTTMNNHILRTIGTTSLRHHQPETVQDVFDRHVKNASEMTGRYYQLVEKYRADADKFDRFRKSIRQAAGTDEGGDLQRDISHLRQQADACASYRRLADARRTRLCAINEALECEDATVFKKIDDLQFMLGIATNTLEDVRDTLQTPEGVELQKHAETIMDSGEELLGLTLALETAIRREWSKVGDGFTPRTSFDTVRYLGLRVVNGQKAIDELVTLSLTKDAALEFYANRDNWLRQGSSMTEKFFAIPAAERDAGLHARVALGKTDLRDFPPAIIGPMPKATQANAVSQAAEFARFLGIPVVTSKYMPPGEIIVLKRRRA